MQHFVVICFVVVSAIWVRADDADFRAFTSIDGRVIEARILEYNPSRKQLRIERRNKNKVWVEPSVFSEEDRRFVKSWVTASEFQAKTKVRITIEKHKKSAGKSGDDVHYSITFHNRTGSDFKNLKLDYRFYVEGNAFHKHSAEDSCIKGKLMLKDLPVGARATLNTNVERMREEHETYTESYTDSYGSTSYSSHQRKIRDYDAKGIWFKISGPEHDGITVVREQWYPPELNKRVAWEESPIQDYKSGSTARSPSSNRNASFREGLQCLKDNKAEEALELFLKAYDQNPDEQTAQKICFVYSRMNGTRNFEKAEKWALIVGEEFGSGYSYNQLAMLYAAARVERFRNGEKAVEMARKAVEFNGEEDWVMDTLACAYARAGQFDLAVTTQEEAYKLAKKRGSGGDWLQGYKKRLDLYKQHNAYDWNMKL